MVAARGLGIDGYLANRKHLDNHQAEVDWEEILNLNSLKLNIKHIWWELDSDSESIPRPLAAAITKREEQVYKEDYQNKVLFLWNLNQSSAYIQPYTNKLF